jgi:hypothetical protein
LFQRFRRPGDLPLLDWLRLLGSINAPSSRRRNP